MDHQVPWENIQYYLKNPQQKFDADFEAWLDSCQENRDLWNELRDIYAVCGEVPDYFTPNETQAWQAIEQRTQKQPGKIRAMQYLTRIAASFLLIMLGASAVWFSQKLFPSENISYTEVYSPYGHKTMVILPDSSKVWLNGDSRLRYATSFKKQRRVELTGEALFEVKKDPRRLFSVCSNHLRLEVYGTTFNYKTYDNDSENEIALVEGSLGVFHEGQLLHKLTPGEVVTYLPETAKYYITQGNMQQITSWHSDELVIDNEPLANVIKYLERWYGVKIQISGDFGTMHKLSFKVKTESLQELLSVINRVVPIQYEIEGKNVQIFNQIK